jgi:nitroimidazol reductase NimA-like FMN-containing flavoprotein (pyridoxamine 5'-phosphate oxidase superfamily)
MAIGESEGILTLEPRDCWTLLRTTDVGRLAVNVRGEPDIFPINFVVDHGSIVFRTASGTKLAFAVIGSKVAFEADGYDADSKLAWSVVLKGAAHPIENLHEFLDAARLPLFPWHESPKNHFVRVEPDEISGRRFPVVDQERWRTAFTDAHRAAPE